jgi:hypothetical protein
MGLNFRTTRRRSSNGGMNTTYSSKTGTNRRQTKTFNSITGKTKSYETYKDSLGVRHRKKV